MSTAPTQLVADRYRLMQPLGQGGMGRVWRARDEVLQRDVAIKELVPPPGLTADERREMRERSLREARAIAQLNHVNVVRVFDVLRTDADPWIVMEYVPSRSLQDVIAQDGPLPPVRVAEIGLGMLAALRAAHRVGVLHRDVKPGNVLLGDDGRVVLTDFGLATVPGDPAVTRTGLVLGSPAYIAPERAKDGTAGPQSDLWSLGATLYAAVEGRSPYARPSAMATLAALATEPPAPPKHAGPLKPVLTGLLRKDPASRIAAEQAERLLRRAVGRRRGGGALLGRGALLGGGALLGRGALLGGGALLNGVRRPSHPPRGLPATISREPQADVAPAPGANTVPAPRPAAESPVDTSAAPVGPAPVAAPAGATEHLGADSASTAPPVRVPIPANRPSSADAFGAGRFPVGRRRRGWLLGALGVLLVAVLLVAVVFVPWTDREPDAGLARPALGAISPDGPTTVPSEPTSDGSTPDAPSSSRRGFVLPAGWHLHRDPTGFSVPVPNGWRVERQKYGSAPDEVRVYFTDPRGGRTLLIDQTNSPKPDPVADWKGQEAARKGGYSGYRRVTIKAVDYWDEAADWEWTYNLDGVRVHVRNRGFITAPDKAYGMFWRTPESVWTDNLDEFDLIARGFKPARS